jgi:Spy/CpxP family protein refolding chaperone
MKTSTNKILTIAVVLLLLANIALVIFMLKGKDRGDGKRRERRGEPAEMMAKELGMSEEQKTQYKKMRDKHLTTIRPLFDSISNVRKTFLGMVKADNSNDSIVNSYSNRVASIQSTIDKLTLTHFRTVRGMFRDEQLKKYDDFVQRVVQRMSAHPGWLKKDSSDKKNK